MQKFKKFGKIIVVVNVDIYNIKNNSFLLFFCKVFCSAMGYGL